MKTISFLVVVTIIITVGVLAFVRENKTETNTKALQSTQTGSKSNDNQVPKLVIGDQNAKGKIIEYGDFKCPSCNKFHRDAGNQLRRDYIDSGKLSVEFRPIAVIGPDSKLAAVGAFCANKQTKFVEYHDAIFNYMWDNFYKNNDYSAETKDILTEEKLSSLAQPIGVDLEAFRNCLQDKDTAGYVSAYMNLAGADEVKGTPTFILSNQKVVGPQPYSIFKKLVDIQLR